MTANENFKILTPRLHVRERPGMYLGSTSVESVERFILGEWKQVEYIPALSKMIDEITDNALDEAIRTNFKNATKIDVSLDGEEISIEDNGRGIPHDEVWDEVTKKKVSRPYAAWTKTNAGTSFNDERVTIGANGVGSACTNFMSKRFLGETWQKGKLVSIECSNGAETIKETNGRRRGNGTKVTFTPDFSLLETDSLYNLSTIDLIEERLTSLQMAFPEIKFTYNKKPVKAQNFDQYAKLFADKDSIVISNKSPKVVYFFCPSEDGFRTNSFVNGVNTRLGGSYVDHIVALVCEELVSIIKRKHKIDVGKNLVKNGLSFVLFVRDFKNPRFDSQTKERLTSTWSTVRDHFDANSKTDPKQIAKMILENDNIIQPIIEAQIAKKLAAERRAATLAQKKLRKVKVAKHIAATTPDSTLFLCEGDSALDSLVKVRDAKKAGGFPLRGVVTNTWDMTPSNVLKNKELSELIAVLGIDINDPDSIDGMSYEKIGILVDADHDGLGHIAPLLIAFFHKFWPRIIQEGKILMVRSPIMISTNGKNTRWFYSYKEANNFKNDDRIKNYKHRYIKGLASLTEEEYSSIINEPVFDTIRVDNPKWFDVMFGQDSTPRKECLSGRSPSIL